MYTRYLERENWRPSLTLSVGRLDPNKIKKIDMLSISEGRG